MEATAVTTKTKWGIDPSHSEVGFKVKHLVIANVRGVFTEFSGDVFTTGDDFMSAEINFRLNPASVNTNDEKRDGHVRNADFFDTENFKEILYTSNSCKKLNEDGRYELLGDLTIKGIKKSITLTVEFGGMIKDPWGNQRAVFTISGKVNRKDWGLNWNAVLEAGGVMVSEDVWINCEVQLVKQQA